MGVFDRTDFSEQDKLERGKGKKSSDYNDGFNSGFSAGYDAARQRYMPVDK